MVNKGTSKNADFLKSKIIKLFFFSHELQLGVPNSYLMMSYAFKFQDEDKTRVRGSVKYVSIEFSDQVQMRMFCNVLFGLVL